MVEFGILQYFGTLHYYTFNKENCQVHLQVLCCKTRYPQLYHILYLTQGHIQNINTAES
uniref:Uncharacterized protein n=1 Tax=Anguilla anguilla TaxID=7936 RepID=A0A0E9SJP6_ANGAN